MEQWDRQLGLLPGGEQSQMDLCSSRVHFSGVGRVAEFCCQCIELAGVSVACKKGSGVISVLCDERLLVKDAVAIEWDGDLFSFWDDNVPLAIAMVAGGVLGQLILERLCKIPSSGGVVISSQGVVQRHSNIFYCASVHLEGKGGQGYNSDKN